MHATLTHAFSDMHISMHGVHVSMRHMLLSQVRVLRLSMPPQVDLPLERPPAQVTGERLEAGVLPRMRYQV